MGAANETIKTSFFSKGVNAIEYLNHLAPHFNSNNIFCFCLVLQRVLTCVRADMGILSFINAETAVQITYKMLANAAVVLSWRKAMFIVCSLCRHSTRT